MKTRQVIKSFSNGEYRLKLYVNNLYNPDEDYYTSDPEEANKMKQSMERNQERKQADFCKEAEKQARIRSRRNNANIQEHLIYTDEDFLSGLVYIDKNHPMPEWLTVNGEVYKRQTKKERRYCE